MQDFLAAETGALSDSLRDAETELARVNADLERRRAECRQLVRMCEQRRQETLAAAARGRGGARALAALDALGHRLARLTRAVRLAYTLPPDQEPTVYHNELYSRSDSGEALSPEEEAAGGGGGGGGGLLANVARALRHAAPAPRDDDRSHMSDENDNSADLLDSETEPCLVTDPECAEEWWSGAEGAGAWSGDELSPERDFYAAAAAAGDPHAERLAAVLREKIDITEKNVADVVVKKLAELDASKNMMDQYRQSVDPLKKHLVQADEEDDIEALEEELSACSESERRALYVSLDAALSALGAAPARCPRLAAQRARLERLAFALAAPPRPRPTRRPPRPPRPRLRWRPCRAQHNAHTPRIAQLHAESTDMPLIPYRILAVSVRL
ncbi:unnamed protein product [Spodoptera littoralis]|uniref:Uncharacterized protein n=1 Tax=Spodoptera littoralis TaxID=7109 RepID=A0A9P0N5Q9_SPOLI|nr:unnamed protein product [Spodoptera littoralis]CAH1645907.1 unnamed protein product [Spodoptera littoralis]